MTAAARVAAVVASALAIATAGAVGEAHADPTTARNDGARTGDSGLADASRRGDEQHRGDAEHERPKDLVVDQPIALRIRFRPPERFDGTSRAASLFSTSRIAITDIGLSVTVEGELGGSGDLFQFDRSSNLLYGFHMMFGGGYRVGSAIVGIDAGVGVDGQTSGEIPLGFDSVIEAYAARWVGPIRLCSWARGAWLVASTDRERRADGSPSLPFFDGVSAGVNAHVARRGSVVGWLVGGIYEERMGVRGGSIVTGMSVVLDDVGAQR